MKYSRSYLSARMVIILSLLSLSLIRCKAPDKKNSNNDEKIAIKDINLNNVRQFITAMGTEDRLSEIAASEFEEYDQPNEHIPTLILDPSKQFQKIEGIGGALTDASAETFYKLPIEKKEELLTAYFDPQKGIGYTLCRTHINSCDFSSESYAYTEVPGDTSLKHFSIEHDFKYRIPLIRAAMKHAADGLKILASPWSPPAWMKTNNNMLLGGKLKPEYFQSWADYYVKFIDDYFDENIPIWGLTVQNEPKATQTWESCIYSAEEERDFVKNYLGPTLEKNELADTKLLIWDHNRGIMYQRASTVLDDPEASKYVWGTGFHWYTGNHFDNVKLLNETYPDKKLLFTEGCVFPFDSSKLNEWQWGEQYGESLIMDLNNSAVGWIDWNILLDETGGPNHVSNFCYAPVIGDTRTGELFYMNSFYYLGHFSKFIKPGARRIICSSNYDDLLATAFINHDESIAVVAMNKKDEEINFKIWLKGKGLPVNLPSHAITTIILND